MSRDRLLSFGLGFCCVIGALLATASPARAAANLFLKIDGMKGESRDDAHKEWIEIQSFSTGVSQPAAAVSGMARSAGKAEAAPFTIVKPVDATSPQLFLSAFNGKHIPKVEIDAAKSGDKPITFLKYTLSDVIISSVRTSASAGGDGLPTEEISFSFSKIAMEYMGQDPTGKGVKSVPAAWDLGANKAASAAPAGGAAPDGSAAAAATAAPEGGAAAGGAPAAGAAGAAGGAAPAGAASAGTPSGGAGGAAPAAGAGDAAAAQPAAGTKTLTRAQRERMKLQPAQPAQPAPAK